MLTTGSAIVTANLPIGVSAPFSTFSQGRLLSEAGVLDSLELDNFSVAVDNTNGARVGMALFNPDDANANLTLRLLDAEGRLLNSAARSLNAKFHESKFVDELFTGLPADFRGALSVSSSLPISGVALRVTGALLATIPVISLPPRVPPYVLPQVANGRAGALMVKTTFILTNPSNSGAAAEIILAKGDGSPFEVTMAEQGTGSRFSIELAPRSTQILRTDGSALLTTGAAVVNADVPIGISAIFSIFSEEQLVSEAGVLDALELDTFTIPVDTTSGARVGVALVNAGRTTATVTARLLDTVGRPVRSTSLTLGAKSHEPRFVDELFSGLPANFKGALSVSSTVPISSVALRLTGSLTATVPVIRGAVR